MSEITQSELASKGGKARKAALSPERRSEIARKAVEARWEKDGNQPILRATHAGILKIGDFELECAVLENGDRVLSQRGFMAALGIKHGGSMSAVRVDAEDGAVYPLFLAQKNLRRFIDAELLSFLTVPIRYRTHDGGAIAHGVKASLIPRICGVWMTARNEGVLHGSRQLAAAAKADVLLRGLAEVGIVALVDEATGYQDSRASNALAKILESFVAKELRKWVPTFRPDYFKELCRLRGWPFKENYKLPRFAGKLTDDLVYKRLAPGVRDELRRVNPADESGRRKAKHHQWLTGDFGHPKLEQHLAAVTALMRAADQWPAFEKLIDRSLPRQPDMPLFSADSDETKE